MPVINLAELHRFIPYYQPLHNHRNKKYSREEKADNVVISFSYPQQVL
jgi:hypothetical protein